MIKLEKRIKQLEIKNDILKKTTILLGKKQT